MMDFILNGQMQGSVADRLLASAKFTGNIDPGVLRPWLDKHGRSCVDIITGYDGHGKAKTKTLVTNAPATLTKEAWQMLDNTIIRVARKQLRIWGDLLGQGLTFNVPDAMGVPVIQHQTMTDSGEAAMSMDGMRQTNRDRVLFDLKNLPLPIIHSDFSFSLREILVSQRGNVAIDTAQAEQATRKCMEQLEKLTLGTAASYSYGGGTIYGLTNFPQRIATSMTAPTTVGWTPKKFIDETLGMIQALKNINFTGPYGIWYSMPWMQYLNSDYATNYPGSLMRRAQEITGIQFWNEVDYLDNFQVLIVQLSPDVIQAVTGMAFRTLQWDEQGGLAKNFKIMGIQVPRIRATSDNVTGINHGVGV